jgi:branched-chain amino acid transport system substrate-binding protein
VQNANLEGASGPVAFDQYGDTTNRVLTVYSVKGDDFAPIEGSTGSFAG